MHSVNLILIKWNTNDITTIFYLLLDITIIIFFKSNRESESMSDGYTVHCRQILLSQFVLKVWNNYLFKFFQGLINKKRFD